MSVSKQKQKNRFYSIVFTIVLVITLLLITFYQNRFIPTNSDQKIVQSNAEQTVADNVDFEQNTNVELADPKQQLLKHIEKNQIVTQKSNVIKLDKQQLIDWVNANDFAKARHYLIKKASSAVDVQDNSFLGEVMQLLGRVSATEGDLASTEVYLFEALDIFKLILNHQQIANTQLLIGRMYAKRREIAKRAGNAYDDLLIARYYLSKGRTYVAKQIIDSSIEENLELGRSGAVASAYKSLARYYGSRQNYNDERDALVKAANYYAESGQDLQAMLVLSELRQKYASADTIETLRSEIESKLFNYESQINLVRQARDYMKLYSLYKSKGQQGRAWEFRVKASEILSRSDKRDMYFRMPDVMALLFDSNTNLDKAEDYYAKARQSYLDQNDIDAYNHVVNLQQVLK